MADVQIMFDQCLQRMRKFTDIPDSLVHSVQSKTLILLGDHDVPLPESAVEMYRVMPHASLAIFPGAHGDYTGEIISWKDGNEAQVSLALIRVFLK